MSEQIPPEEQERIAREVAEQLRNLRVEDVLIQSLITISSIGYQRLGTTEDTASAVTSGKPIPRRASSWCSVIAS